MKVNPKDWEALMTTLSEDQKEAIKAKCNWEHVSWLGVLQDWPSLFENSENTELIEKILLNQ